MTIGVVVVPIDIVELIDYFIDELLWERCVCGHGRGHNKPELRSTMEGNENTAGGSRAD